MYQLEKTNIYQYNLNINGGDLHGRWGSDSATCLSGSECCCSETLLAVKGEPCWNCLDGTGSWQRTFPAVLNELCGCFEAGLAVGCFLAVAGEFRCCCFACGCLGTLPGAAAADFCGGFEVVVDFTGEEVGYLEASAKLRCAGDEFGIFEVAAEAFGAEGNACCCWFNVCFSVRKSAN